MTDGGQHGRRWDVLVWAIAWALAAPHAARAGMATLRLGTASRAPAAAGRKPTTPPPSAHVARAAAAPAIDARLDEPAWAKSEALSLARTLDGSRPAPQPTEVRLLRDERTLYVAFRCAEPLTGKIRASSRGRDGGLWSDDSVEVFLGAGGPYYHFIVNAAGSVYDARGKESGWNSAFRAAAAVGKAEWTAELAIPLASLAGEGKPPDRWRAGFNRNRHAAGTWEETAWSPTFSGDSHVPSRFGDLRFQDPPATRPAEPPEAPQPHSTATVLPCEGGQGLVRFDLSALPRDAKVYRADLLVFRDRPTTAEDKAILVDIEVYPLFEPPAEGSAPRPVGKPLALRAPWLDRLDATDAVRAWAGGRPNGGFFVKALPYWRAEATCLDIAYEAAPAADALPAQVTGLEAFHRAGQTFLTWKEIDQPVQTDEPTWAALKAALANLDRDREVRYCVYRSRKPITAETLADAEPIATVKPLSCWNVNGRNLEKPIDELLTRYALDHHQWNPFVDARVDGPFGLDCKMERLAIRDGGEPLARGRGLYVHTTRQAGDFCYAVVAGVDGVQNTAAIGPGNSLARPLAETPADPQPVLQKELPPRPHWNYRQRQYHYVRWVGPPYGNLPSEYYNWSVAVPDDLPKAAPLELSLHRDEHSYWRTQYRLEADSIVVSPHDFPLRTWWYGYHESQGTLRSFARGAIHNYTERRLLWFVDWVASKWPVDRGRIGVTAMSGAGTSGALHLALRHPEVFNTAQVGHGALADYRRAIECLADVDRGRHVPDVQRLWGRVEWDLETDTGRSVWDELDCTRIARASPAELPLVTMTDRRIRRPTQEFFLAMLEAGRPVMARFGQWGGGSLLPVSLSGNWSRMIALDVRRDLSLPAFRGPGASELARDRPDGIWAGELNDEFRWDTGDLIDRPDRYEITLSCPAARGGRAVADVTLTRRRRFRPAPGRSCAWQFARQAGRAAVAQDGRLTVPGLAIPAAGARLIVTIE